MTYLVLARKWRPRSFNEMVGQSHVVRALANALDSDRIHHAFLFTGTRGVGKTTIARILAKCLNCEQGVGSRPCGVCSACREIDEGRFVDLIEVDAASRTGVDETRDLLDNVPYAPASGRYKVYLIDEVHMFSPSSFNALLKTLEEPPPHVKFLLATTDPQKLPVTILSRCLQFNLKRLPIQQIAEHLGRIAEAEGVEADGASLGLLAVAADGSIRDALSLLDQAVAFGDGRLLESDVREMLGSLDVGRLFDLLDALAAGDGDRVMAESAALADQVPDFDAVLAAIAELLHRVAMAQIVPDAVGGETGDGERVQALEHALSPEDTQLFYQMALMGRRELNLVSDPRAGFEMTLLRMLAFRPREAPAAAPEPGEPRPPRRAVTNARDRSPSAAAAKAAPAAVRSVPEAPRVMDRANDEPWAEVIRSINVSGMTRQMAMHSILERRDEDVLYLRLDEGQAHLLSSMRQGQLQQALSEYYGRSMKLRVEVGEADRETPAMREQRAKETRQRQAEEAIDSDPNVRKLVDTFGASVIPESVRPVD